MAPNTNGKSLKDFEIVVQTALALVRQLQSILDEIRSQPTEPSSIEQTQTPAPAQSSSSSTRLPATPAIDVLALSRDSSTLLRAHVTKLSLLLINPPFTPSAIITVVRELISGPIPGIASAVQLCDPQAYTAIFRRELAAKSRGVLEHLATLFTKIPKDGKVLDGKKEGFGVGGKGSIASTGVLWAACDDLIGLANGGVPGFLEKKVLEWKDTLKDVMEEMKEWGEEEPDEDEEDNDDGENIDGGGSVNEISNGLGHSHIDPQDILDDMMNSASAIPRSDPNKIRPRLESSLRRIRLVILLFQAVNKRRIKTLPPLPIQSDPSTSISNTSNTDAAATKPTPTSTATPSSNPALSSPSNIPQRLDEVAKVLQKIPAQFNELQCMFYELQPEPIDRVTDACFFSAFAASEMLREGWLGETDGFTEWAGNFQREMKKV